MDIIVTRHAGAIDWLKARGVQGEVVSHLDDLPEGARVYGVLPLQMAVQLLARNCEVYLVQFPVRNGPRGQELSASDMETGGAQLLRFGLQEEHSPGCFFRTERPQWIKGAETTHCTCCGGYYTVRLAMEPVDGCPSHEVL